MFETCRKLLEELFTIKAKLQALKYAVLFNWVTKQYEVYTYDELDRLKEELLAKGIAKEDLENNDIIEQIVEEERKMTLGQIACETKVGKKYSNLKKKIYGLNNLSQSESRQSSLQKQVEDYKGQEILDDFEESEQIITTQDDREELKCDMTELSESERQKKIEEEKSILRPWQVAITADFMRLIFKEVGDQCVLYKSFVIRKFIEGGVPLTWNKLCASQVIFEKKMSFPPWNPKRQFTFVIPIQSIEKNSEIVQEYILKIIKSIISDQQKDFQLPLQVNEITKSYQKMIQISDPPLFIASKQQCQSDNFKDQDWAMQLIQDIETSQTTLFLPQLKNKNCLSKVFHSELQTNVHIPHIISHEKLYNHLKTKYADKITQNDTVEKIVPLTFLKLQYRLIKVASGNFFLNEYHSQQNQEAIHFLEHEIIQCDLCSSTDVPSVKDLNVLELEQQNAQPPNFQLIGQNKILVVDSQEKLVQAHIILKEQESLGVDLEGKLKKNGQIVLLQLGCKDDVVIIFDIYTIEKDFQLYSNVRKVLNSVFMDQSIRKVFFDGRKDIEALHFILWTGIKNAFDVQGIHMIYSQVKELKKNRKNFEIKGIMTPGLNEVLRQNPIKHGINTLKSKFKAIFQDFIKTNQIFYQRPICDEFLSYASQDVQDLSELADILKEKVFEISKNETPKEYWERIIEKVNLTYSEISCNKWIEFQSNQ
eukprot:403337439